MTFSRRYKVLLVQICQNLYKPTCINCYDVKVKARGKVNDNDTGIRYWFWSSFTHTYRIKIAPKATPDTLTMFSTAMYAVVQTNRYHETSGV